MEPDHRISVLQTDGANSASGEKVDVELVRRTKAGDTEAFEELFNRYQKRVYNIVYRIVGNENDAAELTQEVFVKVFNSIDRLRAEQAFFTWLRTVAVNVCRDYGRRKPPQMESLDAETLFEDGSASREIADTSAGPEKLLLSADRQRAVRKAVAGLPQEHRTVVMLHHLEGMDIAEIANMLGSPIGTIKSRLSRAREELRRKLLTYIE